MRKIIVAVALAALALLTAPAPALSQEAPDFDHSKFYVHVPIKAEGHSTPMFYYVKPFDSMDDCNTYVRDGWTADTEFRKNIGAWAQAEMEVHDGKVVFGPPFCWSPSLGPSPAAGQDI